MCLKIDIWKINISGRLIATKSKIKIRIGFNWNFRAERDWKLIIKILIGSWLEKNINAWITLDGEHSIKRGLLKSENGCFRNVW